MLMICLHCVRTETMDIISVQFVEGITAAHHSDLTLHHVQEQHRTGRLRYEKPCASGSYVARPNKPVVHAVFKKQKLSFLSKLDLSKKGCIDEAITDIVVFINNLDQYFTTSSCSGRICIYEESDTKKKSCNWLYVTHDTSDWKLMWESLRESRGDAFIKFEPFVLHVQCASLADGQLLHSAAIAAGFRNSGLSVSKHHKIIAYVKHVSELANHKLQENFERINRFHSCLQQALLKADLESSCQPSSCMADVDLSKETVTTALNPDSTNTSASSQQDCNSSTPLNIIAACDQATDYDDILNVCDLFQ